MSAPTLAGALASGSPATLREALTSTRVAVVAAEHDGEVVPAVMTGPDEVPTLLVFSSQETYGLWGRPELVLMVPGSEVGVLALAQPVERVVFDPAGPTPYTFEPSTLAAIVDGIETAQGEPRVHGDLDLRAAPADEHALGVRDAVRPLLDRTVQAFLVERVVESHGVLTLAVLAPTELVEKIAAVLARAEVGTVDVIALDQRTAKRIARGIPQSRINPI